MTTLPLTVCVQTVEPCGEEYHVDIINLGVPYDGRIYTLGNLSVLEAPASLYLRYVCLPGTLNIDRERTVSLGDIEHLRLVGGTVRGTFRPSMYMRNHFDRFIESMNGKLILGAITEVDFRQHRDVTYAEILRIRGAQVLLEDGQSLKDTVCSNHELLSMVDYRACNPKLVSIGEVKATMDDDFLAIAKEIGFDIACLTKGDLSVLRTLYLESLAHYRVNPMLVGGPYEPFNGIRLDGLHPKHIVYIKNQFIRQLRTERFKHVTATTY